MDNHIIIATIASSACAYCGAPTNNTPYCSEECAQDAARMEIWE